MDLASGLAPGALSFDRASIAYFSLGLVEDDFLCVSVV
jgi:hypothetical protein